MVQTTSKLEFYSLSNLQSNSKSLLAVDRPLFVPKIAVGYGQIMQIMLGSYLGHPIIMRSACSRQISLMLAVDYHLRHVKIHARVTGRRGGKNDRAWAWASDIPAWAWADTCGPSLLGPEIFFVFFFLGFFLAGLLTRFGLLSGA